LSVDVFVAIIVLLFPSGDVSFISSRTVLDSPGLCAKALDDMMVVAAERIPDKALMLPICVPVTNTRGM
jgi:hypothetical protein